MTDAKLNDVYERAKSKVFIIGKTALDRIYTLVRIFKRYCDSSLTLKLDTSSKLKISLLIPIALSYFMFPFDVIPGKSIITIFPVVQTHFPIFVFSKELESDLLDFIPFLGYLDDLCVIGFVWGSLNSFITHFQRWEKYESRIKELEDKNKNLLNDLEKLHDEKMCCVCMEEKISVILSPCKHAALCSGCADLVSSCPLCRTLVKSTSKVFL